jgi:hypothetical protein
MHHVYFLARIYPYWALPLAFVMGQLGLHFRRRKFKVQYSFWGMLVLLIVSSLIWIVFRGDLNADQWVRILEKG